MLKSMKTRSVMVVSGGGVVVVAAAAESAGMEREVERTRRERRSKRVSELGFGGATGTWRGGWSRWQERRDGGGGGGVTE